MKSENQKTVEAARKLCTDPRVALEWKAAWGRVCDRLDAMPNEGLHKNYTKHRRNETARAAFLKAAVAGTPLEECEEISFATVDTQ